MRSSMRHPRAYVVVPTAFALALACSREPSNRVGADTAAAVVPSDSASHAVDVALTPAQAAKVHVAAVTYAPYRTSVQTTGTVAFNGDRSTQVLAPVSGPITRILV